MDLSIDKAGKVLSESPHGDHYKLFAIEPLQYTEVNKLGFHEGNVIKYITRWRLKDGLKDLEKARFYIERLIEIEKRRQPDPPMMAAPVSDWQKGYAATRNDASYATQNDMEEAIVNAASRSGVGHYPKGRIVQDYDPHQARFVTTDPGDETRQLARND